MSSSSMFLSEWGRQVMKKVMKPIQKYKAPQMLKKWNIVSGDLVQVIQGPQAGQKGKILNVIRKSARVIIDGVNLRRRIVKPKGDGSPGKIITKPCSIHYSNVMLLDPSTGEPTKISRRYLEDGSKVRISKKSGVIIPKPDPMARRPPRTLVIGPKDTLPDDVFKVTFSDYEKYLPYIYDSKK